MRTSRRSIARRAAVLGASILFAASTIACGAAVAQTVVQPPARNPVAGFVAEASQRFGIPEDWIYAVMRVESAGDSGATSVKGAMGLMQVMPGTYADLRARHGLGPNAYDPRDNIFAGAAYLREMYDRYGSPGFLAAYNAGPGRYEESLAGRPLPLETRAYLARLSPAVGGDGTAHAGPVADPHAWTRAALFTSRPGASESTLEPAPALQPPGQSESANSARLAHVERPGNGLFVPLSGVRR